jgi:hypothetical protein
MKEIDVDIEFSEPEDDKLLSKDRVYKSRTLFGRLKRPTMIVLLKKARLARTDKQAYYILFSVAIICLVVMFYTLYNAIFGSPTPKEVKIDVPPIVQDAIDKAKTTSNP